MNRKEMKSLGIKDADFTIDESHVIYFTEKGFYPSFKSKNNYWVAHLKEFSIFESSMHNKYFDTLRTEDMYDTLEDALKISFDETREVLNYNPKTHIKIPGGTIISHKRLKTELNGIAASLFPKINY